MGKEERMAEVGEEGEGEERERVGWGGGGGGWRDKGESEGLGGIREAEG